MVNLTDVFGGDTGAGSSGDDGMTVYGGDGGIDNYPVEGDGSHGDFGEDGGSGGGSDMTVYGSEGGIDNRPMGGDGGLIGGDAGDHHAHVEDLPTY